jgi:cobalamin synthase
MFGVVATLFLFAIHFAAVYTVLDRGEMLTGLIFLCVVSRAVTGIALLNRPPISSSGYMASFQRGTKPRHTLWLVGVLAAALGLAGLLHWKIALSCAVALLAALLMERALFYQLQGLSGDLCGCVLTAGEMCGLLCLAVL